MVVMPLRRRLLLILPSLVAGFREAQHTQGLVPCKHLARRELFDEIEDKGAWPGERVLPLTLAGVGPMRTRRMQGHARGHLDPPRPDSPGACPSALPGNPGVLS